MGIWNDDAFNLEYVEVPNNQSTAGGTVEFEDLGGEYRLEYEWRWVNKGAVSAAQASGSPDVSYNPDYRFDDLTAEIAELWEAAQQTNKVYLPLAGR